MNKIIIVGLGTCESDLTLKAVNLLKSNKTKIVRTTLTSSFLALSKYGDNFISLDNVYLKSRNFDTLNKNLAKEVINLAKQNDVVYFVDGCALEDNSVKIIAKKYKNVEINAGVSYATKCLERISLVGESYTAISAYDVLQNKSLPSSLVVYSLTSKKIASEIKLKLMSIFGEEVEIYFTNENSSKKIYLYELDRQDEYSYQTAIYVPKLNFLQKTAYTFSDLVEIVFALRGENGCPWDKVQTFESLQKNLIEECYELVDAINSNNVENIVEEIGDVLLQAVFYSVLGEEGGLYYVDEVVSGICSKLISRHTHVFGEDKAVTDSDALNVWNKNKAIEKGYKNGGEYVLSLPKTLPALLRAQKVQSRASKYNFDFDSLEDAISKIFEEVKEVKLAYSEKNESNLFKECGDLLFSVVNVLRLLNVDSESALMCAVNKFIDRFIALEKSITLDGKDIKKMTTLEIDEYYRKIKKEEN